MFVDQSLVQMAGTDGQAKKGQVVVEISVVEADPITVTSRLKKPPFLRWVGHGLSRDWIDTNADVPTTRRLNRGHTSVSDPVSRKGPNQEPLQILGFLVGLYRKDQPTSFTYSNCHASSMTPILEMTGTGKTPINIRMSGRLSDEATTSHSLFARCPAVGE